jgi:O-antigen biosynthesis protein
MIKELFLNHKGKTFDKWSAYLDVYDKLFTPLQDAPISILEIGVMNGGSLEVWAKAFPNSKHIVGVDINPDCAKLVFDDSRITMVVGDANDKDVINQICTTITDSFSIIIDDGSHIGSDVIRSFNNYFPLLGNDSLYVVEDMHSSYWQEFGGALRTPVTSMSYFKRLADISNYEHWRLKLTRSEYLKRFSELYDTEIKDTELSTIHSIQFFNSMVVVNRKKYEQNLLGNRVILGDECVVKPDLPLSNGTTIAPLQVTAIDDWQYDPFEMAYRINRLSKEHNEHIV